jgi:hypothetical protein
MRILSTGAITTASAGNLSAVATAQGPLPNSLAIQANFAYGSGGTTVDAYVQTSFDGGGTWTDIAEFNFTTNAAVNVCNLSRGTAVTTLATPTDGSLSSNSVVDGFLGSQYRRRRCRLSTMSPHHMCRRSST